MAIYGFKYPLAQVFHNFFEFSFTRDTAAVGDQQCLELPGFINPAIGSERARGPMTRTRTNSEMQGEAPRLEGPYQPRCDESKTGTPRTTDPRTEGPLRKVKKMNKPRKKEPKKMGEKMLEINSAWNRPDSLTLRLAVSELRVQ